MYYQSQITLKDVSSTSCYFWIFSGILRVYRRTWVLILLQIRERAVRSLGRTAGSTLATNRNSICWLSLWCSLYVHNLSISSSQPPSSVTIITKTITICHYYHHHNYHHLSLSSSQPPSSVTIITKTTNHLPLSSQPPPGVRGDA